MIELPSSQSRGLLWGWSAVCILRGRLHGIPCGMTGAQHTKGPPRRKGWPNCILVAFDEFSGHVSHVEEQAVFDAFGTSEEQHLKTI